MAFIGDSFDFDVETLPQGDSFDPLPAGWYSADITACDLKDTKAGNGQMLAIKYTVTGPTHQGRVVFGNLNIRNPNATAEKIGRQQLGDIMRATGLAKVTDTDQLVGLRLQIKLSVRTGEYAGNEVKGFKPVDGAAPMPKSQPTSSAQPAVASSAAKSTPPWARK
jgi:hypothetical protein